MTDLSSFGLLNFLMGNLPNSFISWLCPIKITAIRNEISRNVNKDQKVVNIMLILIASRLVIRNFFHVVYK